MGEPSAWVTRWAHLIPRGGEVLDVAAGGGRHARWLACLGHPVTAIDRDATAMQALAGVAETLVADIEAESWPLAGRRFAAVVVTNYLWRPLMSRLVDSVDVGGVLLYETFARGNETVGRPSSPQFLLEPGELLAAAAGLRIVAYEHGFLDDPDRFVQRLAAVRLAGPGADAAPPARHALGGRAVDAGRPVAARLDVGSGRDGTLESIG